jgi:hypothetical protein
VIPDFDVTTGNLPSGEHLATWQELVDRFGHTAWRRRLLAGLFEALRLLKAAGCGRAYIDGSFVTAKEEPGDFDACWDADGVDFDRVDERRLPLTAVAPHRRPHSSANFLSPMAGPTRRAHCSGTSFKPTATGAARASWSST